VRAVPDVSRWTIEQAMCLYHRIFGPSRRTADCAIQILVSLMLAAIASPRFRNLEKFPTGSMRRSVRLNREGTVSPAVVTKTPVDGVHSVSPGREFLNVPHSHFTVAEEIAAACSQNISIGAESERIDFRGLELEGCYLLRRLYIPETDRAVATR